MKIAIQALTGFVPVGAIMIGVLLHYDKQTFAVWVTFATVVAVALGFCLY